MPWVGRYTIIQRTFGCKATAVLPACVHVTNAARQHDHGQRGVVGIDGHFEGLANRCHLLVSIQLSAAAASSCQLRSYHHCCHSPSAAVICCCCCCSQDSSYYVQFRMFSCEAYNILRKSSDLILSLFHLMAGASIEAIRNNPENAMLKLQVGVAQGAL